MKNFIAAVAAIVCNLLYLPAPAQPVHQLLPVKPLLFNSLAERTAVTTRLFDQLFAADTPQKIKIPFGEGKFLQGTVKEKAARNKNVTSVIIECTNFDGALLTVSRITGNNQGVTYTGRVVNIRYGDVLLLVQENGGYYFTKQKQSLVIVE